MFQMCEGVQGLIGSRPHENGRCDAGSLSLDFGKMKVVVEILTGILFSADVADDGTVADLKQEIGAQQKLPRDRLILLLRNCDRSDPIKDDEDGARLADVGIQDGSHIYLFFKPVDPEDSNQPPPPAVAGDSAVASPEDQTVVHSTQT